MYGYRHNGVGIGGGKLRQKQGGLRKKKTKEMKIWIKACKNSLTSHGMQKTESRTHKSDPHPQVNIRTSANKRM